MKRADVFERIEPPPGGLAKLRDRLDARPSAPLRVVVPVAAALAIAAALALIFGGRRGGIDVAALARASGDPSEVALGLAEPPAGAVSLPPAERATSALVEVPTADRRVAFYWVSSTSWEADRDR